MELSNKDASDFLKGFYDASEQSEIGALFRGNTRKVIVPAIIEVVDELEDYHPLTVRQVFYQLVSREIIPNNDASYKNISRVLTVLRRNDLVDWDAIEDRSRRMVNKRGITDLEQYLKRYADDLFQNYQRCYVQNQGNYCEVWTEKDALSGIITEAVWMYCTKIVVCRGNLSSDFLHKYAVRAEAAEKRGQTPIILYVGDFDPTGLRIPVSIIDGLKKHHRLTVRLHRVALNKNEIEKYDLPSSVEAIKEKDPNYDWFIQQGGDVAVELDALHPQDLTELITDSLDRHLDLEDMDEQKKIEAIERKKLKMLERGFKKICHDQGIHY